MITTKGSYKESQIPFSGIAFTLPLALSLPAFIPSMKWAFNLVVFELFAHVKANF